jgi:exosortase/archaeosortase family protein
VTQAPSARLGAAPLFTAAERTRVTAAAALALAFVLLTPRDRVPMLEGADVPVARVTATLVRAAGIPVARDGAVLRHPAGFGMEVYWRCTGLVPAAFVAALVLASPPPWRWRLLGAAAGAGVVLLLNLARLVSLFAVGALETPRFAGAHALWEIAIGLSVPLLWLAWLVPACRSSSGE